MTKSANEVTSMFVVVGSKEPLYKMEMRARREESAHVDEFVLHAALDLVDELMWTTPAMFLKVVDRFNDQLVSAFVTASGIKFLLLHETRNDDTVKAFFHEVHDLYVKVRSIGCTLCSHWQTNYSLSQLLMNPFYEYDTPIHSDIFDARVKTLARRYL
ncbi:hypothetical protein PsorP6_012878 [Peronosclerospora sorghi]|uniref:Uncharacterized protein n=1 Tax=Peronosclerospora sorghi TaxID=230839 RepID=A0ACC0WI68_9STRA|nr:hypothetical protein PsorP6_012878 [Peronosclerospora sorghi]